MQVEGIPEGWLPVRFDYAVDGEAYIKGDGEVTVHVGARPTQAKRLIVRKIEKPKQFRAFANEREAEPFWDAKLRYKVSGNSKEPGKAMFRVNCIGEVDVGIAFSVYSYQTAFEIFECIDGTPFGVEVTE